MPIVTSITTLARYYDPYIGRFTQRDPIGDGVNWYAYTYNNPLKYTDPTGQLAKVRDLSGSPVELMHSVFWDPDIKHFAFNDGSSVTWHSPDKLASLLLDFTPIIGDAKGFVEGIIGQELLTGEPLSPRRSLSRSSVAFRSPGGLRRGIDLSIDLVDAAIDARKHTGKLPEGIGDIRTTLERIKAGKKHLHRNDGSVFKNKEGLLPPKPKGYYREYVHPTPGVSGAGQRRVVIGQGGEMYYTSDHYKTFTPLNTGGQ